MINKMCYEFNEFYGLLCETGHKNLGIHFVKLVLIFPAESN